MRYNHRQPTRFMIAYRVEDGRGPDRVLVTDANRSRHDMSLLAYWATCRLAPDAVIETDRILDVGPRWLS